MRFSIATIALFSLLQCLEAAPAGNILPRQNTRNDLQNGACKKYTLIFARGTAEPAGNLGSVGAPFAAALEDVLGDDLAVQGVAYAASIQGAISGDPVGNKAMAAWVAKACGSTKIILGGYSQGAQLTHGAVRLMSASDAKKIDAIVTFGDPKKGKAYKKKALNAKTKTYCHAGDTICSVSCKKTNIACLQKNMQIKPAHKTYPDDVKAAARWVKSMVG
ncbi:hypothetical protein H072_12 [Dactylellina haptotyla CBS 200.50]|uniref:cutinase n=1 Tax=Dactylellina haptotyla (strain CBS 200.50) TaxID=1284197 RepID=S8CE64_DACHA|nr:hypothetical protein H072_12 [Dactylellina haptotyla CBS 200.50]